MFHFYNRAAQVIVWLGDGTSDGNRVLKFINHYLDPCYHSVGFSCTDERANLASRFWEEWDDGRMRGAGKVSTI